MRKIILKLTFITLLHTCIFTNVNAQMPDWVNALGNGNGRAFVNDINTDASGNIYIIGHFENYVFFDPLNSNSGFESNGSFDIFFAKYNSLGTLVWVNTLGSTKDDRGNAITLDNSGNIYITGIYKDSVDFDPSPSETKLISAGNNDVFFAKYDNNGNLAFANSFGGVDNDLVRDICLNSTNHIILTGSFYGTADFDPSPATFNRTSAGSADIYLASYDNNGSLLWVNSFGETGFDGSAALAMGNADTIYVTGRFNNTVDFDPSGNIFNLTSAGGSDIFLAKYVPSGAFVWAFSLGAAASDEGTNLCLHNSDLYLTGTFQLTVDFDPSGNVFNLSSGNGGNNYDAFIAKYNAQNGNFINAINIGGINTVWPNDISANGNGNVYLTGYFMGTADFDSSPSVFNLTSQGNTDIFLATYTSGLLFTDAFGTGKTSGDEAKAVAIDNSGNVLLGGNFIYDVDFDPSGGTFILDSYANGGGFLAKYTSALSFTWAKNVNGKNGDHDVANKIKVYTNGDVYVMGYFQGEVDFDPSGNTALVSSTPNESNLFIAKYSQAGSYMWAKALSLTNGWNIMQFALDVSGNMYITGELQTTVDFDPSGNTFNLTPVGNNDIFIAKYNNNGDFVWAFNVGGTNNEGGKGILIDNAGDVIITGYIRGTVDFDPSGNIFNITVPSSNNQIFWAKYTSAGNFVWAKAIESVGCGQGEGYDITCDAANNYYIVGRMSCTTDFDPSGNTSNLVSNGGNDAFLAKYSTNGDFVWAFNVGGTQSDNAYSVAVYGNKIGIAGKFRDLVDFDPSVNVGYQLSNGMDDLFLALYDLNGNYLWSKGIGGTENDGANSIYFNSKGEVFSTGYFSGQVDFNPMSNPYILQGSNMGQTFVASYDSTGIIQYAFHLESSATGNSYGNAIHIFNDDVFVAGSYTKICDFDPSSASIIKTSNGKNDMFFAKYNHCSQLDTAITINGNTLIATQSSALYQWIDCNANQPIPGETNPSFTPNINGSYKVIITKGLCVDSSACINMVVESIKENNDSMGIKIYPNPAKEQLSIFSEYNSLSEVKIYNSVGSILLCNNIVDKITHLSVSEFPAGLYFVQVKLFTGESITQKLIIQ
ncbi:MAG: T9SS type A sorting domain-containing protein [Flavobacteriales bacterium]|nr:T9SS type A sorting domain-containing protein [Flavobacteriales bacterium]